MKLFEVTDEYSNYLKQFFYSTMLDNKENNRKNTRKYLGIVFTINNFNYFAPLSSPKNSDYDTDGNIKKSTTIVLRMIKNTNGKPQLLGTIKLNNMIPVPSTEIIYYDLNKETNIKYKNLIIDELYWIQRNTRKIQNSAKILYNLKNNEQNNINSSNKKFYKSIMPFKDAEAKCSEFSNSKK